jgi:hypothetical protein
VRKAAFGLVLLVFGACQTAPEPQRVLSADIFEDIPAPRTARVQTDKALSFSYRSESFRCAKYVYRYNGDVPEAVEFFEDVMTSPPYSWDLREQEDLPAGSARLSFRKGDEYCTVDIRSYASSATGGDPIKITICVNYE